VEVVTKLYWELIDWMDQRVALWYWMQQTPLFMNSTLQTTSTMI